MQIHVTPKEGTKCVLQTSPIGLVTLTEYQNIIGNFGTPRMKGCADRLGGVGMMRPGWADPRWTDPRQDPGERQI